MSDPVGVVCRVGPGRTFLNVRGDPADPIFRDAVAQAVGVEIPVTPCTWNRTDRSISYWLGPDEWLLAGTAMAPDVEERLRDLLDRRFSVVDVTGAQIQMELSGAAAGKVLQKSSPYDFHPRNFPPSRCIQTVFAKATALVAAKESGAFDIVVRRSYADYVERWIADAADEYGFRIDGDGA